MYIQGFFLFLFFYVVKSCIWWYNKTILQIEHKKEENRRNEGEKTKNVH